MYVPDSYWTSVLFATLSTYFSLVSSFCTLGQMFAADFFQIPPRDGHPCLSGYTIPTIRARWGLAPVRQCSCRAYKKKHDLDGCASFFHYPASKTFLTKGQNPFAGYSLENGIGPNFSQMLFTATLSAGSHLTLSSSFIANQRAASCSRSVS